MMKQLVKYLKKAKGPHRKKKRITENRANLLIISFDQWRGDWGNVYRPVVNLQEIGRIAEESLVLQKCYTSSPQCVPARFSWITGLQPSQLGVTQNEDISLPMDSPSNIKLLKQKGWHTRLIGKTHWTSHISGKDLREKENIIKSLGFEKITEIAGPRALRIINCQITDDWEKEGWLEKQREDLALRYRSGNLDDSWKSRETVLPNYLYPDIWIAETAKKQINELPNDKPWIFWISFVGPHEPFDTPKPWRGQTKEEDLPKPIRNREWIERLEKDCNLSKIDAKWKGKLTQQQIANLRKDYADHLCLLDKQTEGIMHKIKKRKDYRKTAILIMSDHGEMLGDGGMLYKSTFLESSINVPTIYRPPNGTKHKETLKNPTNLTELFNTVLRNLEEGGRMDNIIEWVKRQEGAIVEFAKERAFIKDDKKICLDYSGNIKWATDIGNDPKELINQAEQYDIKKIKSWKRILKWSKKMTRKRNENNWIWRNLLMNKYDQNEA